MIMYKFEKRTCCYCGQPFECVGYSNRKYCSIECRESAYGLIRSNRIEKRNCHFCGKEFEWGSRKTSRKYCSPECRRAALAKNQKSVQIQMRKCCFCGKEFRWSSSKPNQKYCSSECRRAYQKANSVNKQKTIRIEKRKCAFCGKDFEWNSSKPNQKYCTKDCRDSYYRINTKLNTQNAILRDHIYLIVSSLIHKSLEEGENYNGKYLDYWKLGDIPERTRETVFSRDQYKCRICGKDTSLDIHHIIKRINGGSHDIDNLITLCKSCHRAIEIGDLEFAVNKCFRNAKIYYSGSSQKTVTIIECREKLRKLLKIVEDRYFEDKEFLKLINSMMDYLELE